MMFRLMRGLIFTLVAFMMFINVMLLRGLLGDLLHSSPEETPYLSLISGCINVGSFFIVFPPYLAVLHILREKVPWSVSNLFRLTRIIYLQMFLKLAIFIAIIPLILITMFLGPFNLIFFFVSLIVFVDNLIGLIFGMSMSSELLSGADVFLLGGGCLLSGVSLYVILSNIDRIMDKAMMGSVFLLRRIAGPIIDEVAFEEKEPV